MQCPSYTNINEKIGSNSKITDVHTRDACFRSLLGCQLSSLKLTWVILLFEANTGTVTSNQTKTTFFYTVCSLVILLLSAHSICYSLYHEIYHKRMKEALCYKLEGRGFKTWWGEWMFSIYLILLAALGPEIYSAFNRNEYQKQKNNVSWE
jgi:hypothetical protein